MSRYDPQKHHRSSIRLRGWDYRSAGAYFVTVVVHHRVCLFGEIINDRTRLNEFGQIVEQEWIHTGELRTNVILDEYVIMPNHFHGILIIHDDAVGPGRPVGATRRVAPTVTAEHPKGPPSGSLGAIVGQFKSICTKRINRVRQTPGAAVWQRNYYERILRNNRELNAVRRYIHHNPINWNADAENPNRQR